MLRRCWNNRWFRRLLIALVAIGLFGYFLLPRVLGMILTRTLQAMVSSQLNADLSVGSVYYYPPLGVEVRDAMLQAHDGSDTATLLSAGSIWLDLAKQPFAKGPLVIRELIIQDPTIRIIDTPRGIVGSTDLIKDSPAGASPGQPSMKLSDMFELRRVAIKNAAIEYDDRRQANSSSVQWKDINIDLRTHPKTRADYAYEFKADNLSTASVQAAGMMNIDTLFFVLDQFVIEVQAKPGQVPQQLPPSLQSIWKQYAISGKLRLDARGQVPLARLDQCSYQATLDLHDASAMLADIDMPMDSVNLRVSVDNQSGQVARNSTTQPTTAPVSQLALRPVDAPIDLIINNIEAASGDLFIKLKRGSVHFDPQKLNWSLDDVAGRISFPDDRPKMLADLPGPMQGTHIRGNVPIKLTGSGSLRPAGASTTQPSTQPTATMDYDLALIANGGQLFFTPARVPLSKIKAQIAVDPVGMRITDFTASPMNGRMQYARGELKFDDKMDWSFSGTFRDLDMSLLGPALVDDPQDQKRFSGKGTLVGRAGGSCTGADSASRFHAGGELTIVDGSFWQIGVMKGVASSAKVDRNSLTVGEMSAEFSIRNRKIFLENAALSAPAIGVQGSGTIDFDGNLDLTLSVLPLGDWRKNMQKSDVPLISQVGSAIAGGIQDITGGVTKALLFDCRVKGPASNPDIQTVAAPALTSGMYEDVTENRIEQKRMLEALKKMPPRKNAATTRIATTRGAGIPKAK